MIDISTLPSWSEVYFRLGEHSPRRNRGRCPIHGGDSPSSVSLDEDRGVYYCHVCHSGGDKITFVSEVLRCDFKDALRFFGIEPGMPPAPDPAVIRRRKIREGLRNWARTIGRELRFEHYVRERVIARAQERLARDPDDDWGWNWLAWAYTGLEAIAHKLGQLEGDEAQQVQAYKELREAS
jgi:hypothetical protein